MPSQMHNVPAFSNTQQSEMLNINLYVITVDNLPFTIYLTKPGMNSLSNCTVFNPYE